MGHFDPYELFFPQNFCEMGNLSQLILLGKALNFNKPVFTDENTLSRRIPKPVLFMQWL